MPTFGRHRLAGLDVAWSAFEHDGVARRLVAAAKYRSRPGLVEIAAAELFERLPEALLAGASLVPVPPDPWRSRRRGFDLAAELARSLALLSDSRVIDGLRRARSAPQAGKGRAARLAAEPKVRASKAMPGRLVLIDDVVTTGTTIAACAEAARRAGAVEVDAVTLTRTAIGSRPRRGRVQAQLFA